MLQSIYFIHIFVHYINNKISNFINNYNCHMLHQCLNKYLKTCSPFKWQNYLSWFADKIWLKQQNSPFKIPNIPLSGGKYRTHWTVLWCNKVVLSFRWICVNIWPISPGTPQSSYAKKQTEVGLWHCWWGECSQRSWRTRNTGYAMATNLSWKMALPQGQKPWQRGKR